MSKRKNSGDSYEHLMKKIKKLEREVFTSRRKKTRVMRISSDSTSSERSSPSRHDAHDAFRSESEDRQEDAAATPCSRDSNDDLVALLCQRNASPARPRSSSRSRQACHSSHSRAVPAAASAAPAAAPGAAAAVPVTPAPPAAAAPQAGPSTAPVEPVASTSTALPTAAAPEPAVVALDDDLLEILGIDPTKSDKFGPEIHKEVAIRFEHCATTGLTKEVRKELTEKHLIPANCKLVDAPALNPEMKAALSEPIVKRDKAIEMKQKIVSSAISSLGEAITLVLSLSEKQPALLRLLIDTGRLICDSQYYDSQARRNYVLSSLKKEMKEQMKATKIDNLLFGQNFQDTLKTAKAINRSGVDLKATSSSSKPKVNTKPTTAASSKNWRNSNPNRKQTTAPRTRTTTSTATRNTRSGSSRTSQPARSSRR